MLHIEITSHTHTFGRKEDLGQDVELCGKDCHQTYYHLHPSLNFKCNSILINETLMN